MIQNFLQQHAGEITAIRHHIHRHPELGFEEAQTSQLVAEKLREWGYEVHVGLAKTGVVGTLKVGNGDKVLGIRADMDALPILEQTDVAYKSQHQHVMHACGHDGHTTVLLAAAQYLATSKNFNGTLHVIFQPAEEFLYGGKVMVDDGLFELFPCDLLYGFHNMPGLKAGEFYIKPGAFMASADTLEITITGVGGHGAYPYKTVDATLVASHIVVALQSIVGRNIDPLQAAVVTVGSIHAGSAANIIAATAELKISVRALSNEVRAELLQRVHDTINLQAQSFGASATIKHVNGCPVVMNDAEATDYVLDVMRSQFGEAVCHTDVLPSMASEDFAYMLEAHSKGCYFFVGNGDGAEHHMVHHPQYDFNDDIILPVAQLWCALAERYLR
jgi:hippurate hydrolase